MSFREIWLLLWWVHHQTISNNIKQLVNQWYIREDSEEDVYIVLENPITDVVNIPVYWSAQCWNHGTAVVDERPIDYIPYATKALWMTSIKDYFFVQAKWKSMEPFIHSGDLVLIKWWWYWWDGDKVMVIHNWKPKIKKIASINKKEVLISLNKEHEPTEIQAVDKVIIVGQVKKVIKNI